MGYASRPNCLHFRRQPLLSSDETASVGLHLNFAVYTTSVHHQSIMSASGLSARQRAAEGMYFASEERLAIGKYLERQVAEVRFVYCIF